MGHKKDQWKNKKRNILRMLEIVEKNRKKVSFEKKNVNFEKKGLTRHKQRGIITSQMEKFSRNHLTRRRQVMYNALTDRQAERPVCTLVTGSFRDILKAIAIG